MDDDPHQARPSEVATSDAVEKTKSLVLDYARIKKRQLTALVEVSETIREALWSKGE